MYIDAPPIYIIIKGNRPPDFIKETSPKRIFKPPGLKGIYALLCNPDIKKLSDNNGFVFFIVGATARDFIYEYYYDVHAPRATRDLDLAVEVESWAKFDSLKQELIETGEYEENAQVQRLIHNGVFVDIIPFGLIADREKNIKWPPGILKAFNTVRKTRG